MAATPANLAALGSAQTATYNTELATLQHQLEAGLAGFQAQRGEAEGSYKFALSKMGENEPRALTAEQNKANTEGLLESGINAQRRGQLLAGFTRERGELGSKEQNELSRLARGEQNARESYNLGVNRAGATAQERYLTNQINLAPSEPPAATPAARPAPPKGGWGGIGKTVTGGGLGAIRKAAARRAMGRPVG